MGYDAACTLRFQGRTLRGKAVLESHELLVRGPERVVFALKDVTSASADGGALTLRLGQKTAVLELGADAAKWAKRIVIQLGDDAIGQTQARDDALAHHFVCR